MTTLFRGLVFWIDPELVCIPFHHACAPARSGACPIRAAVTPRLPPISESQPQTPKHDAPPPKRHFGGSDKSSLLQETQHPDIDSDEAIERLGADILEHGEGRSSALRQVVDGHRLMLMPMPMMPPPRAPIQAVLPRVHPLGSPPWIKFLVLFLLAAWLPLGLTLFDCHRWSGHGRV